MPKSTSHTGAEPSIDWAALEADYREGRPVRSLVLRYRISASSIYRRARRDGWLRNKPATYPAPPKTRRLRKGLRASSDDIAQLRKLAGALRRQLSSRINGRKPSGDAIIGARESPAALLLKLCQITEKLAQMDRRATGADGPSTSILKEQDHDILERFKRRHGISGA